MQTIKGIIQQAGLKATPQRIAIYNAMMQLGHSSADMVANKLKDIFPSLTVATIYNVLESFTDANLIVRRFSSNNKMYFDINTYEHIHLYNETDHSYIDYNDPQLTKMIKEYFIDKKIPNFNLKNIEIQLIGNKS